MSLPNSEFEIRAENFAPGYVDGPRSDRLPPGATPDARNSAFYDVNEAGTATTGKRAGCRLVTPAAIAAGKPVDLAEFRREASPGELLGYCNGAWSKFDDGSVFNAIAGATGYAATRGRLTVANNQALLHDGTKQQLYDGASVRDVGFAKPTAVTALGVAAGPGVTGTYSARYTWFDQTHNHESSPAVDVTANQVYANQQRVHTKPTGAPPAHVTHWRAYVRREDTGESYWMRVATVAIATATVTEAVIDRVRVDPLPLESENDPPTVNFAVLAMFNGYAIGFASDSSTMHVSKKGDFESWPPKQQFPVAAGEGKPVRAARAFGTELVLFKPHRAHHLIGTRVPFDIDPLHGSLGLVSQEAGLEVKDWFYGWDEVKGPYRTNLVNWEPLADTRLARFLKLQLNRAALDGIRAEHDETNSEIVWLIPTIGSTRKRVALIYNYVLGSWRPPMTGLEYASIAQYTTSAGAIGVYLGDEWGRVWRLNDGTRDAPATGTVRGTVTGSSANSLTDAAAAFYTTGSGLAGVAVAVRSPAGVWQWRRIFSNTGTQLTLDTTNDTAWTTVPGTGGDWTYIVGGIQWYQATPIVDGGKPEVKKKAWQLALQLKPASAAHAVEVQMRFNENEGTTEEADFSFSTGITGGVWGQGLWGQMLWGSLTRQMRAQRIGRTFFSLQIGFSNFYPDQPIQMTSWLVTADRLSRRRVRGPA